MHILMIESNPAGMAGLLQAATSGHTVTFLTADPSFYLRESPLAAQAFAHERCRVVESREMFSLDALRRLTLQIQGERPIDGVVTYSEYHTIHAAEIAHELALPGMSPHAARATRFKNLTRVALSQAGIPQPRFRHIEDRQGLDAALRDLGFPCVIKPVDGTASLYVTHLASPEAAAGYLEAAAAGDYGRGVTRGNQYLVEEYVPGELVSVESCVEAGGVVHNFGITDRRLVGFPNFIEMGGTFYLDHPARERLFELNTAALQALGVDYGFIHTEFLLGPSGPVLLEVNGRLAGGILPRMFWAASGVDPFVEVIRQALGERPRLPRPSGRVATGRQFGVPVPGVFQGVDFGSVELLPGFVEATCYPRPGQRIEALSKSNFDWVGHVIFVGENREESLGRAEQALEAMTMTMTVPVAT
jgi:biotin carboxylase